MSLSNIADQSEYLNEIERMHHEDDKPTDEGVAVLDAALASDPIQSAIDRVRESLNEERALLKAALHLVRKCREEVMPFHLRRDIDDLLVAGKDYL